MESTYCESTFRYNLAITDGDAMATGVTSERHSVPGDSTVSHEL